MVQMGTHFLPVDFASSLDDSQLFMLIVGLMVSAEREDSFARISARLKIRKQQVYYYLHGLGGDESKYQTRRRDLTLRVWRASLQR